MHRRLEVEGDGPPLFHPDHPVNQNLLNEKQANLYCEFIEKLYSKTYGRRALEATTIEDFIKRVRRHAILGEQEILRLKLLNFQREVGNSE